QYDAAAPGGWKNRYSNRADFLKVFRQDKAVFEAWLKKQPKETQKAWREEFGYYFSQPYEAWADIMAWMMDPRENQKIQNIYFNVFDHTTDFLIEFAKSEGIPLNINGNYKTAKKEGK